MEYNYQVLRGGDVKILRDLLKVFGEAFEDISSYQEKVPSDDYLQALLNKENFIVIVARCGGEVVGGLAAYVLEKFEQERSEIYIYDLAVALPYRRQGIATKLINVLQEEGKRRGSYVIFVQADQGDTPAIKLYEKLGTREDVYHFDIPVNK
jgi:aminoglycoside 3-N-acetyltransferase I